MYRKRKLTVVRDFTMASSSDLTVNGLVPAKAVIVVVTVVMISLSLAITFYKLSKLHIPENLF